MGIYKLLFYVSSFMGMLKTHLRSSSEVSISPTVAPTAAPTDIPWHLRDDAVWSPWEGLLEFGQTHMVRAKDETRHVPKLSQERETELLFTPQTHVPGSQDEIIAYAEENGRVLGTVSVRRPKDIRGALDGDDMPAYSTGAYSATIPWKWFREAVTIVVATKSSSSSEVRKHEHVLRGLGPPLTHLLQRVKSIIFGSDDDVKDLQNLGIMETIDGSELVRDMWSIMPFSEVRWLDSVWRLPYLIVETPNGPRRVENETHRRAVVGADAWIEPRWHIIKEQGAMRISMADQGTGLARVFQGADNSGLSIGTVIHQGYTLSQNCDKKCEWKANGQWSAWAAAAWTGWCGMRGTSGDESGNLLPHELGHSQTMHHFTGDAHNNWGIAAEYPDGGKHHDGHAWGYDTPRRQFRTWFTPKSHRAGGSNLVGKRDPMNGGEPATAATHVTHYTGYQAQKSQRWSERVASLLTPSAEAKGRSYANVDAPDAYKWDASKATFARTGFAYMHPVAIDVPVATFVGTLGYRDEACQIYPPRYASSGNVFANPDPFDDSDGKHSTFHGAAYFVAVHFRAKPTKHFLIAKKRISKEQGTKPSLFSFNVALAEEPTRIVLWRTKDAVYPNLVISQGSNFEPLHEQWLSPPPISTLPRPLRAGRGHVGYPLAGELKIKDACFDSDGVVSEWCTGARSSVALVSWRHPDFLDDLRFESSSSLKAGVRIKSQHPSCKRPDLENQGYTLFDVEAVSAEDGSKHTLHVAASVVTETSAGTCFGFVDAAPLGSSAESDATISLRVWVPLALNDDIPKGEWKTAQSALTLTCSSKGIAYDVTAVHKEHDVQLVAFDSDYDHGEHTWVSKWYEAINHWYLFLTHDVEAGVSNRVWYQFQRGGQEISVAMQLQRCATEEQYEKAPKVVPVKVRGLQDYQSSGWSVYQTIPMNSGGGVHNAKHRFKLQFRMVDQKHLSGAQAQSLIGCTYATQAKPLLIDAKRWHNWPHTDDQLALRVAVTFSS